MIKITATFAGKDGSCGFRNGEQYNLIIKHYAILRQGGHFYVPYKHIEAFLRNWTDISVTDS